MSAPNRLVASVAIIPAITNRVNQPSKPIELPYTRRAGRIHPAPARTSSGDPGAHSRNVPDPRLARRSEPRVREAQVADRSDEARLDRGRGADDPAVLREPFALPEIERGAGDVGHDAARLARDDRAGGVVPDLLDVA